MNTHDSDKIDYIETCLDDIQNFIAMFRDGEYTDSDDFWSDVSLSADAISNEAMRG